MKIAHMMHEYAGSRAKVIVWQGFQHLLKKYSLYSAYRLAIPHWFWRIMRAHAPSTRATAMIAVASTRIMRQSGMIISTTRSTCGLIKLIFAIVFLFLPHTVTAASWYQVEVIVFDRLYPNLDGEQWQNEEFKMRDNLVELESATAVLDSEQNLVPYMILDINRHRLNGVNRVLKLSSEYRPLLHLSWQQPAAERRQSRYVHIQKIDGEDSIPITDPTIQNELAEEPEFLEDLITTEKVINGSIRIRSGFFLHADIDLSYFKTLPVENKIIRTSEESFQNSFDKSVIKLKETRKIKLNEIHYFDHPMYGVILQVSRLN